MFAFSHNSFYQRFSIIKYTIIKPNHDFKLFLLNRFNNKTQLRGFKTHSFFNSIKDPDKTSPINSNSYENISTHVDNAEVNKHAKNQIVTPWEVQAFDDAIDYNRLIQEFGTQELEDVHIQAMKKSLNFNNLHNDQKIELHPFLRRRIFFSHRSINRILGISNLEEQPNHTPKNKKEDGIIPHYLYTGRGPSSTAMHIGHLIPFMLTKWWSDAYNIPVVIQMTDDEKFLWKKELNIETVKGYTFENAKDIIATGFSKDKTFIFSNLQYIGRMYENIIKIQKSITFSQAKGCFGFASSDNIGKISFPSIQAAPSFPTSFRGVLKDEHTTETSKLRCLIPCAIDQDPYFRLTRELAPKIGYNRPALLLSQFFPALQGPQGKMSASDPNSAIYLTDSKKELKRKIMKFAYSGGKQSLEEHRKFGGNPDIDVSYQYLRFFLDSDEKLKDIYDSYKSGNLLSGEIKLILVDTLIPILENHQENRSKIHRDDVYEFMSPRYLKY